MLTVPNLLWAKRQPEGYAEAAAAENRVLLVLERVGEVLVTGLALVSADLNPRPWSLSSLWLALSFVLMLMYEGYWLRYFRGPRTLADMYASFLGVPVAGATLPVAAFFALALCGRNLPLFIAVCVLGVGHIGIHLSHRRRIRSR